MKQTTSTLRRLRLPLGILLAAAALYFLSTQISLSELRSALGSVQTVWLVAALGMALAGQVFKALRWKALLSADSTRLRFAALLKYLLLGQLANLFIPGRAGDIGRAVVVGGQGPGRLFTLGTVALEKLFDLAAYAGLAALLLLSVPLPGGVQASPEFSLLTALGSLLVLWVFARGWARFLPLFERIVALFPNRFRPQMRSALDAAGKTLTVLRDRRAAAALALWTAGIWLAGLTVNQLALKAFGLALPASAALLLLIVLQAGITINLSPGTLGIFEFLCLLTLRTYGVPDDQALAFGLILHAVVLAPLVAALPAALFPADSAVDSAPVENGRVRILGVGVDPVRKADVLERVRNALVSRQKLLVTHVHVKGLNLAYRKPWLREFFAGADIVYCDGQGVRLGAKLLGRNLPERFTLADWMDELLETLDSAGASVFFLGNPPGVAEQAARRLAARHPGVRFAGAHHGYFDRSPGSEENDAVVAMVNDSGADMLLVGMGMPLQEKWVGENLPVLDATVVMTVGGVFEYYSGDLRRAPAWVTENGFEWLALLLQAPLRYGRRYLLGNPLFVLRVLRQRFFPTRF